jgi:serine/threonine protein kinase
VIQAIHKSINSIFAIKKIPKKVIKSNMMIDQLLKEIKIQSYCQHENILTLYGVFDDIDFVYLILEYMEEGTLFT